MYLYNKHKQKMNPNKFIFPIFSIMHAFFEKSFRRFPNSNRLFCIAIAILLIIFNNFIICSCSIDDSTSKYYVTQ